MSDMLRSHIPGSEPAFRGKVRDVYDLGARRLLAATPRHEEARHATPRALGGPVLP